MKELATGSWQTRFGFYMAAIGSAFGLGTLWRFPYIAGTNGGGAFVILYIFIALFIGLPLLIAELMLGKSTRQSVTGALRLLEKRFFKTRLSEGKKGIRLRFLLWKWVGRSVLATSVVLLSYYAVVSGWVMNYLFDFTGNIFFGRTGRPIDTYDVLMKNGLRQVGMTGLHICVTCFVVAKGVKKGVERWVNLIMPLFAILMFVLVAKAWFLPGTNDALRFLFYPDFSKFNSATLIQVIGHVFFTLSIGMASMVTFGSYLKEEAHVPTNAFRIASLDTIISLCAGVLIFALVFSSSMNGDADPSLLFRTIPFMFDESLLGEVFGACFFLCLYTAALGASIGLMEASVSNLIDRQNLNRSTATVMMGLFAMLIALVPALSSSVFSQIQIGGDGLMTILDGVLINGVLPIMGLGAAFAVGYVMDEKTRRAEFILADEIGSARLYSHWLFVVKRVAPLLIMGSLLLAIIGWFRSL